MSFNDGPFPLALEVDALLVECGENIVTFIPALVIICLHHLLTVDICTASCGCLKLIKSFDDDLIFSVLLIYSHSVATIHSFLLLGNSKNSIGSWWKPGQLVFNNFGTKEVHLLLPNDM